jgi:hypothetical protein
VKNSYERTMIKKQLRNNSREEKQPERAAVKRKSQKEQQ